MRIPLFLFIAALVTTGTVRAGDPGHAMWVYHTEQIMGDPVACGRLFSFCENRHITDLFWSVRYARGPSRPALASAPELHAFLRAASARHLRIHALSGDPGHVLPANHDQVVKRVEATVEFNHAAPAEERFAGIHFDIEPHGLPEWKRAGQERKCELLTQLVEVNALAVERLHALGSNMLYGADITFWFDKSAADGAARYPVTFRGVTKDASKHLLDLADNVGIMSYRNRADGPNGIISLVTQTIDYADHAKGKAYIGVKMADIGPPAETFFGQGEAAMQTAIQPVRDAFSGHRGYAGIAYFMYEAYLAMTGG